RPAPEEKRKYKKGVWRGCSWGFLVAKQFVKRDVGRPPLLSDFCRIGGRLLRLLWNGRPLQITVPLDEYFAIRAFKRYAICATAAKEHATVRRFKGKEIGAAKQIGPL